MGGRHPRSEPKPASRSSRTAPRVEHRITLKIAGGPLRSLDLRGVDRDAVPEADGYIVPAREAAQSSLASAVPIALELMPPGNKPEADGSPALSTLKIRFQNEKGIGRGVYVILLRYGTNLASRISADGAMAKLQWKGPVWPDGLASVRATFELPAAPTEPRADDANARALVPGDPRDLGVEGRPLILSTLRRGLKTDALELLRPYVPKGEAPVWTLHADLRAFTLTTPAPRRAEVKTGAAALLAEPAMRTLWIVGAIGLFLIYTVLVALKSAEVARDAEAAGSRPQPLVPIPAFLRALLAGVALVAGLWVELFARKATIGALLILAASLLAAHRPPPWKRGARLRGPGRWLPVAEALAFKDPPRPSGGYLVASTRPGKVVLALVLLALGAGVVALHEISPYQAALVAFDVTALLAVFGTGLRSGLPPDPGKAPARFLRDVARRLRKSLPREELRIVGKIRVPEGASEPDELRLVIAPKASIQGFSAIEIGVVYLPGMGGPIGLPEALLRFGEGSPCEAAIGEHAQLGALRARAQGQGAGALVHAAAAHRADDGGARGAADRPGSASADPKAQAPRERRAA